MKKVFVISMYDMSRDTTVPLDVFENKEDAWKEVIAKITFIFDQYKLSVDEYEIVTDERNGIATISERKKGIIIYSIEWDSVDFHEE